MKKGFWAVLLAFILVLGGAIMAACGQDDGGKTSNAEVVDVRVMKQPNKTNYLKGETFDITGGEIAVMYDDSTVETVAMTSSMYETADTSQVGTFDLTLNVTVKGKVYNVTISYSVAFSQASLDFINLAAALPMLNAATVDDVDDVLAALEAYANLTEEEKAYVDEGQTVAVNKVNNLSRRLAPLYLEAERAGAREWREFLNENSYTEDSLAQIDGLLQAFMDVNETTIDKAVEAREKLYEDLGNVSKRTDDPSYTLEAHKQASAEVLRGMLTVDTYHVVDNGMKNSSIERETINYGTDERFSAQVEAALAPIQAATTMEEVDTAYAEAVTALRGIFLDTFTDVAKENLTALVTDWRDTMKDQLDRYDKATIGLSGQYEGVTTDYFGADNRWYIPMPYRINIILNSVEAKLATAKTVGDLTGYYNTFAYELLRATMQRNIEMYHAIEHLESPKYDTGLGDYWGHVAVVVGYQPQHVFTYNGIVDEYVGLRYGDSEASAYRLTKLYNNVPDFYRNQGGYVGDTLEDLARLYNSELEEIWYEPPTILRVEIETNPSKTVYLENDTFSLEGGRLSIVFSDNSVEYVDMTDKSVTHETPDMTGGTHELVLTYTDAEGNTYTTTLSYTVSTEGELNDLVSLLNRIPDASAATAEDIDDVLEVLETYKGLHADLQSKFDEMSGLADKLAALQVALAVPYADSLGLWPNKEILNVCDYSDEDAAAIETKHAKLVEDVSAAETFAAVDELMKAYNGEIAALASTATTKEEFVAHSVASAEKVAEVRLRTLTINNHFAESNYGIVPLKDEAAVKAAIEALQSALEGTSDLAAARAAYETEMKKVYAVVLETYAAKALENVKAIPDTMYADAKGIWENEGYETNYEQRTVAGKEAWYSYNFGRYYDSGFTFEWWAIPACFQVNTIYTKAEVKQGTSKHAVEQNYEFVYYDMTRSVAYRQLHVLLMFFKDHFKSVNLDFEWQLWSFAEAQGANPQLYDGCLDEYQGQYYGLASTDPREGLKSDFRLWASAWGPTKKTTIKEVLDDYNWVLVNQGNTNNWLKLVGLNTHPEPGAEG